MDTQTDTIPHSYDTTAVGYTHIDKPPSSYTVTMVTLWLENPYNLSHLYPGASHTSFIVHEHSTHQQKRKCFPHEPHEGEGCEHPPECQRTSGAHEGTDHNKHEQGGRDSVECVVVANSNQTTA